MKLDNESNRLRKLHYADSYDCVIIKVWKSVLVEAFQLTKKLLRKQVNSLKLFFNNYYFDERKSKGTFRIIQVNVSIQYLPVTSTHLFSVFILVHGNRKTNFIVQSET